MKFVVLGDIHSDWETVRRIAKRERPDFMLSVGDLETYEDAGAPLYFISGNHEDWDLVDRIDSGELTFPNLYHIKSGEVSKLAGLNISGLGGNYSPVRYSISRNQCRGNRKRHFNIEDVERCKALEGIDVFLTHEWPLTLALLYKENKNLGIACIDDIIRKIKPRLVFSGHRHKYFRMESNGVGNMIGLDYPKNSYIVLDSDNLSCVKVGSEERRGVLAK